MKWNLLNKMCCPRCGSKLKEAGVGYFCTEQTDQDCEFKISYERLQEVVRELHQPPAPKVYEADLVDRSGWM